MGQAAASPSNASGRVDPVEEADEESFPASDPPARTVVTGVSAVPGDEGD